MEMNRLLYKTRIDQWVYGAILLAILQFVLFFILKLRPGAIAIYIWLFGPSFLELLALILLIIGLISSLKRRPFWSFWRGAACSLLLITISTSQIAYEVYPSSHDHEISNVRFRLPLNGPINVTWGGSTREVNYHVVFPDQRWAYDLIVRQDGMRHRGLGDVLEDYYVYNLQVFSPADGIVHSIVDGEPDKQIGIRWLGGNPAGNHIVLEVAPNQYLFIGHLKQGSIKVKSGDRVQAGQELGRVGNSGRTQVPHIHIHLQDSPDLSFGEGIPLYFYNYRCDGKIIELGIPKGGKFEQVIENAPF
jgi:hypothetical protein